MFKNFRILSSLTAFSILVIASGCGHIPLTSMYKLRKVEMETTKVDQLAFALKTPNWIKIQKDSAKMKFDFSGKEPRHKFSEVFILKESGKIEDLALLKLISDTESTSVAYRIAERDYVRFNEMQSKISELKKVKGGSMSVNIKPDFCRSIQQIPKSVEVTTYLKTSETGEYIPFLKNVDVLAEIGSKNFEEILPPCNN